MTALELVVVLPAVVGVLLALLGPLLERVALVLALGSTLGSLGVLLTVGSGAQASPAFLAGLPLTLGTDGLSLVLGGTVCLVTLCVLAAVPTQVERRRARLHGFLLLFLAAVLLTLVARSLLPLLIGWELMGAASYALIAHDPADRRAVGSATTALLTTRALDVGLYLAAGAALAGGGTLALDALPALSGAPLHLVAFGLTAAALGKAAQLPVSFWLARAMDGPSPVSALLHSAAMVAMGGYLLLRTAPVLTASGWADDAVAWTGAATAVALGAVALAQRDLKQLLAASTASQLGIVVLAAGLSAREAGAAHLVAHAAVKSLLFLAAGLWLHALHTKELGRLTGAAYRAPAVGALAVVGLLALGGVPPLALWGSEDGVLHAALEHSPALYAAGVLAALLSAGYAGRVLAVVLRRPDRPVGHSLQSRDPRLTARSWLPLVPLALGAALLAALAVGPPGSAFGHTVGAEPVAVSGTGLLLSGAFALGALLLALRHGDALSSRMPRAVGEWLHLEAAAHAVAVRPVLALSRALGSFDDRVLDRAVTSTAAAVLRVAGELGRADDRLLDGGVDAAAVATVRLAIRSAGIDLRGVDGAVGAVSAAARRLGELARRPQTGQLHQYYGQAAALLAAATLLLLVVR